MKANLIKAGKILLIIGLVIAIFLIVLLQWKSDFIIEKVLDRMQSQLTDSLQYSAVDVSGLSYFPCIGIQLHNPHIGSESTPLLHGDRVDVVVALWPLLQDEIQIRSIHLSNMEVGIRYLNGKWSYAVFKEAEEINNAATSEVEKEGWNTMIRKIALDNCRIYYEDGKTQVMQFDISRGEMEGHIGTDAIDASIEITGMCAAFRSGHYTLPEPVELQLAGDLLQNNKAGTRSLKDWVLHNPGIELTLHGDFLEAGETSTVDVRGEWKNGDPEYLRRLVPKENRASIEGYTLAGKSKGTFSYAGESSKSKAPVLQVEGTIDNAKINRTGSADAAIDMDCAFAYHSADPQHQHQSTLSLDLAKKSVLGSDFKGTMHIRNFDAPVYSVSMKGDCPAALINFVTAPTLTLSEGEFDVKSFSLQNFRTSGKMVDALFQNLHCEFTPNGVKGVYTNNAIELHGGYCRSGGDGNIEFVIDDLQWDQLAASAVKGNCTHAGETLQFDVTGKSCGGVIEAKGSLQSGSSRQTFRADWKVNSIEMHTLMKSFSNFDQTFITAENLSGNADIWAETVVPMTPEWEIKSKEIEVKSAIVIKDGRLKNLKTLEDFSKYIHLEELRDIQFSELRNFLKIEGGKVYLPVMFIQSSAINMSIAGVHSFDQSILYNIKLNAGQTLANKLKKTDFRKDLKPARKSGWLNLYFVLEGTTSNVKYQQYRAAVISGFEQSAALKEQLRKYMVDRFGYDVYWIEPNEWEDVPEYK